MWAWASCWQALHRFVSAPTIRIVWISSLLLVTRFTSALDFFLIMAPAATQFPAPPKAPEKSAKRTTEGCSSAHHWARIRAAVRDGDFPRRMREIFSKEDQDMHEAKDRDDEDEQEDDGGGDAQMASD
eukprot:gnl/TRDRNA2_/TRDRNA2_168132_c1_seq4.p1 gnl/TRDRNA2_/TRDRNA2_168132_c1~~gnl/TRDRNA2_/TRDRNA2_168132_c1_seq4.p1  ORF type:complete len:128 (-),score=21.23 gnl/TRDRNA2_/TRDRNA2_168132_c1_seq4:195-578(-)